MRNAGSLLDATVSFVFPLCTGLEGLVDDRDERDASDDSLADLPPAIWVSCWSTRGDLPSSLPPDILR